ncbi:uncharacterized protein LOC131628381 [Vicia villosa]|uniref:uncharacterized protein LOC131628381 n=1 Tax=Vicia villosa TaxID=3911 RepID=UPI00273C99FA|nr:uncharacterized protein LOC131628381 [Vicia villosa]
MSLPSKDLYFKVHNGEATSFWFSKWVDQQPLSEAFQELYAKAIRPFMLVAEAGWWDGPVWRWKPDEWLSDYDHDDEYLLTMLLQCLPSLDCNNLSRGEIVWLPDETNGFSFKRCASEICRRDVNLGMHSIVLKKLSFLWQLSVPSKVGIFGWRFVLGRLPTRDLLKARGIIGNDSECGCVFCSSVPENLSHLFDSCSVTRGIWTKVGQWLGDSVNLSLEELRNFLDHADKVKAKEDRLTVGIIRLSTLWNVWLMRNAIIFKGIIFCFDECLSAIVMSSWKWFRIVNESSLNCNFYAWHTFPLSCIKR